MIAVLMVYAILVGATLAVAGLMAERVAAARRRPRRWIWVGVLTASVALGAGVPPRAAAGSDPRAESAGARLIRLFADDGRSEAAAADGGWSSRFLVDSEAATALTRFDPAMAAMWAASSSMVVIVYVVGMVTIWRRRRGWHEADVQGTRVALSHDEGPAIVGMWRPRIVLPAWALAFDARHIALMLSHEREHLRARDPLLMHLAGLAVLLMPWNPAVWWMFARLKLALELDCDARVLGLAGGGRHTTEAEAQAYGELLLDIGTRRPTRNLLAPAMLGRSSHLTRRFSAMYAAPRRFVRLRTASATAAALGLLTVTLLIPAPRLRAEAPTPSMSKAAAPESAELEPPALPAPTRPRGQGEAEPPPAEPGSGGVTMPSVIRRVNPQYTKAAMEQKIEGTVRLSAVVETDGTVGRIRVTKSLDTVHGLDDAATAAAAQWLFEPATKDGKPVPVRIELEMEFRLSRR